MANPEEVGIVFHRSLSADLKAYTRSHTETDELCGGKYEYEVSQCHFNSTCMTLNFRNCEKTVRNLTV
jgi:hypothetical protein